MMKKLHRQMNSMLAMMRVRLYTEGSLELVRQVEHLRTCGTTSGYGDELYSETIQLLQELNEKASRLIDLTATKPSRKEKRQHTQSVAKLEEETEETAQKCASQLRIILEHNSIAMMHEDFVELFVAIAHSTSN
jgi:hypothetical protein